MPTSQLDVLWDCQRLEKGPRWYRRIHPWHRERRNRFWSGQLYIGSLSDARKV